MASDCQSREKCNSLLQSRDGFNPPKWPGKVIKQLVVKWSQWVEGNERRGKHLGMRVFKNT